MSRKRRFLTGLAAAALLWVLLGFAGRTLAQGGGQNPTPIVITLTPAGSATPGGANTPLPGSTELPPDRFEPNNDAASATTIGLQQEPGLTLSGGDVDYFRGYLKAGQVLRLETTVYGGLDSRLKLFWNGQLAAENDDRSAADVGSTVTFSAPADGWYVARVEKATVYDGFYDLEVALLEPATPTASPTAAPTFTPTPSPTPLVPPDPAEPNDTPGAARPITPGLRGAYTIGAGDVDYFTFIAKAGSRYACETVSDRVDTLLAVLAAGDSGALAALATNDDRSAGRVDSYLEWAAEVEQAVIVKVEARGGSFGPYDLICQNVLPPAAPAAPVAGTPPATPFASSGALTTTGRLSLTAQHLGRVPTQAAAAGAAPRTVVRLLVYYDANNDRQPGPGEGIANVSVLAVDAQGRRLARVFTNAQGEAVFNLAGETLARVIVPFVPGWSARVRVGEAANEIVLGLPAVRLPVFLPVQNQAAAEE